MALRRPEIIARHKKLLTQAQLSKAMAEQQYAIAAQIESEQLAALKELGVPEERPRKGFLSDADKARLRAEMTTKKGPHKATLGK